MTFFSTSKLLEIGGVPFISHNDKPTRDEALEYFRRVQERYELPISFYNQVLSITRAESGFQVVTAKDMYHADGVTLATGFYGLPKMLDVPGEDLAKVKHYYDEAHPYVGQRVAIIGAANSACDVALELFHKGADVTMIIRGEEINPRVKYWIKPNILNRIKEGSITALFNTSVQAITKDAIRVLSPEGEKRIPNDFVLAMTGYQPDFEFLRKAGVALTGADQMPQYDPETHETNVPSLYLAGVVCGGLKTSTWFIENAKEHSVKIAQDVLKKKAVIKT